MAAMRTSRTGIANFCYVRERERGLDDIEDLATPGVFTYDLAAAPAIDPGRRRRPRRACRYARPGRRCGLAVIIPASRPWRRWTPRPPDAAAIAERLAAGEAARRAAFPDRLRRAADAHLVRRIQGLTLVAGYPRFTDWGRDTFIAMRGLLLATGRPTRPAPSCWNGRAASPRACRPTTSPDDGSDGRLQLGWTPRCGSSSPRMSTWGPGMPTTLRGHACAPASTPSWPATPAGTPGHGIGADGDGLLRCRMRGACS